MKEKTLEKLRELRIGETLETKKWIYKKEKSKSTCINCCFRGKSKDDYCFRVDCYRAIYTREVK